MPVDIPDIDPHADRGGERPGFTDQVFDARYAGGSAGRPVGGPGGRTTAPDPGARTGPTAPRSRNSYMRARARRLAASPPT